MNLSRAPLGAPPRGAGAGAEALLSWCACEAAWCSKVRCLATSDRRMGGGGGGASPTGIDPNPRSSKPWPAGMVHTEGWRSACQLTLGLTCRTRTCYCDNSNGMLLSESFGSLQLYERHCTRGARWPGYYCRTGGRIPPCTHATSPISKKEACNSRRCACGAAVCRLRSPICVPYLAADAFPAEGAEQE